EQSMTIEPAFSTSDLRHAVFLLARGFPFLGADNGTGRVRFHFQCSPQEAGTYFGPDDRVSARQLFSAWTSLRTLIDEHRNDASQNRSRTPDVRASS
ncbi:MAG: hypothetical protein ACREKF_14300, partial [Candidatus Methylomirabilales bacterium]